MKKRVFRSILAVALAVTLLCFSIILSVLYGYFARLQSNRLAQELSMSAEAVRLSGMEYLSGVRAEGFRLTWIAADGTVLFDSSQDAALMENHAAREEVAAALKLGEGQSVRYSPTLKERMDYRARRLPDGTVLRISAASASVLAMLLGMLWPILIVASLAVAVSAVLARRMAARILSPLNTLKLDEPLENQDIYEELSPLLTQLAHQQHQIAEQMKELRRQTDEFNQITASMKEGLVLLDGNGVILSINAAAKQLFHADQAAIGQNFITVSRNLALMEAIETARTGGHGETRVEFAGRVYQFDLNGIESSQKTIGAVMLIFDVTDQVFAERNRQEFTANVSHELKTPLQSIMGSAELLENGLVRSEDVPRFMGRIRLEAARLVALIEDIIRLSQLDESGQMPFEAVDLCDIAREAAESLRDAADKRRVHLELHGDSCRMMGVRRLLYEIVYNLLDNAIKYNVEDGRVDVEIRAVRREVWLIVRDTGIGIPQEHQSRIFERFYRVDKSHSKASGGTGLGLSIVKHAVQAHHGTIELTSSPGAGTTIKLVLPVGEEQSPSAC